MAAAPCCCCRRHEEGGGDQVCEVAILRKRTHIQSQPRVRFSKTTTHTSVCKFRIAREKEADQEMVFEQVNAWGRCCTTVVDDSN